jgi:hypothetical protein
MRHSRLRWHALLALSVLGALFVAAGASAATVRVSITGSVTTGATDPGTIDLAAASDLNGANATGSVTVTLPTTPTGAPTNSFHGDVSNGGCVRRQGNQAVIVGKLPVGEQFTFETSPGVFRTVEWTAAPIEDNGVSAGPPVDRARPLILFSATGTNWCSTTPFGTIMGLLIAIGSGDASFGYTDLLDGFPSNPDTDVAVVNNANGLSVTITDAADPNGMEVAVGAGTGFVRFQTCGNKVKVNAGSTAMFTCASLIAEVVTGSAEVELADDTVVTVPAGAVVHVSDNADGGVTIENIGSVAITVTVDGVTGAIEPGETVSSWDFQGFLGPVDNPTTMNRVKAGAAVPLKWRILNALNAPVTDLSTASVTVTSLDCETGESVDQLEETAAGGSGLQNLGGGYYQLNWKTPKSYAGSCKTMHLDLGHGVTYDAFFEFK